MKDVREGGKIRVGGIVYVVQRVMYDGPRCTLDLDSPHIDPDPSIRQAPQ